MAFDSKAEEIIERFMAERRAPALGRVVNSNNTSGVTGVRRMGTSSRWQAYIRVNRRFRHLGLFGSFDEAVTARRAAEEALASVVQDERTSLEAELQEALDELI